MHIVVRIHSKTYTAKSSMAYNRPRYKSKFFGPLPTVYIFPLAISFATWMSRNASAVPRSSITSIDVCAM